MLATELLIAAFVGVLGATGTLVSGVLLWRYKRGKTSKQKHRKRGRELENIIRGTGDSDTEITKGLLHLVEKHDEELDHAAEERAEMRQRIRHLEERSDYRSRKYDEERDDSRGDYPPPNRQPTEWPDR